MEASTLGGPELIILLLLFIFGLWWWLSFLPGKMAIAASTLLISFSIGPIPHPAPQVDPIKHEIEPAFL